MLKILEILEQKLRFMVETFQSTIDENVLYDENSPDYSKGMGDGAANVAIFAKGWARECLEILETENFNAKRQPLELCQGCGKEIYPGETVYVVDDYVMHNDITCLIQFVAPEVKTIEEALRERLK